MKAIKGKHLTVVLLVGLAFCGQLGVFGEFGDEGKVKDVISGGEDVFSQLLEGNLPQPLDGSRESREEGFLSEVCSNWQELPTDISNDPQKVQLWSDGSKVLMLVSEAADSRIVQTTDSGATWQNVVPPTGSTGKVSMFRVSDDRLFYVQSGNRDVQLKSGGDWVNATPSTYVRLLTQTTAQDVCVDGNFFMVTATRQGFLQTGYIWYTMDDGVTWWSLNAGNDGYNCAFKPNGSGGIQLFTAYSLNDIIPLPIPVPVPINVVLESDNGGGNWTAIPFYVAGATGSSLMLTPDAQYAVASTGIYRSEKYWFATYFQSVANNALPPGVGDVDGVLGTAVGKNSTAFIDVATPGFGILTTSDGGRNWEQLQIPEEIAGATEFYTKSLFFDGSSDTLYSLWNVDGAWRLYTASCTVDAV